MKTTIVETEIDESGHTIFWLEGPLPKVRVVIILDAPENVKTRDIAQTICNAIVKGIK